MKSAPSPRTAWTKGLGETSPPRSPRGNTSPPRSPRRKPTEMGLRGTFRTLKGRVMTAEELGVSVVHMTATNTDRPHPGLTEEYSYQPFSWTPSANRILPEDEMDALFDRLCKSKEIPDEDTGRVEHQLLKFDDAGKDRWVPILKLSSSDQREYMCELYQRCRDHRKKVTDILAAKYLQPLGKTRRF